MKVLFALLSLSLVSSVSFGGSNGSSKGLPAQEISVVIECEGSAVLAGKVASFDVRILLSKADQSGQQKAEVDIIKQDDSVNGTGPGPRSLPVKMGVTARSKSGQLMVLFPGGTVVFKSGNRHYANLTLGTDKPVTVNCPL
jgi:hypothetical protein